MIDEKFNEIMIKWNLKKESIEVISAVLIN